MFPSIDKKRHRLKAPRILIGRHPDPIVAEDEDFCIRHLKQYGQMGNNEKLCAAPSA